MTTIPFPSEWIAKAHDALARLADHPWALFAVLLTINTIARPYGGITHDTGSIASGAQSRRGRRLRRRSLLRYGSQDQYSLFSRLAAPLVYGLGLSVAFF